VPNDVLDTEAGIDRLAATVSRALAARFPRRSFFGKVGRYATAAAVGGTASALLWQDSALAGIKSCGAVVCNGVTYTSPCCWDGKAGCTDDSVTCECLRGFNSCPTNCCECGCWIARDNSRCSYPHSIQYCDCCNYNQLSSSCVSSCSCHNKDCFPKTYAGGCSPGFAVRCRVYSCLNNPTC
jgi:hypothetical protein